jgi:Spy/CpxP family protein refolding chaperone
MNGLLFTPVATAQHGTGDSMEQADNPQAMDHKGKRPCKHHGEGHRKSGHHHSQPDWKHSLSDEQKAKMKQIKGAYMKQKLPLKARKKALKLELMALATAENPDQVAIDAKIDQLLRVKKSLLLAKTRKIADIRAQLNEEQRTGFDLYVLKKAERGKKWSKHHGCH